jgi:protein-L-isoaspartate O-methyltransferase
MGAFRSPWLRAAFDTVDRADFIPPRFWGFDQDADGLHPLIAREDDEDAWLRAVWDAHRSVITQMDDGATPLDAAAVGDLTSSVSAPDIVFEKLNQLELEPHHKVLELGTASGCNTAYLCERVGSNDVTTVEIDKVLAVWGAGNLKRAGYTPEVICGDGLDGRAESAPYDRILNTASLRHIPTAWREQAADGALILTPFNTLYASGALLKLRVLDGVASGQFTGSASYMWMRPQRPNRTINPSDDYRQEPSPIDPAQILDRTWAQDFALGLHVADISFSRRGEAEERRVQLWDPVGTSVTIVNYSEWWDESAVTVWGPRNLWTDVVQAYTSWRQAGQPHVTRYGLTIDDHGQTLWLDEPTNTVHTTR